MSADLRVALGPVQEGTNNDFADDAETAGSSERCIRPFQHYRS
jgi:hypothetical protein